jgi:hypothetical protein
MNNIFSMYQQLMNNPAGLLSQRFNIPQDVNMSDPNAILNHLVNSGQVSQAQINNAMNMRNNPMVQMLMRGGR